MNRRHFKRAARRIEHILYRRFGRDALSGLRVHEAAGLEKIGSEYGGWIIPTDRITATSICYCAGVGEDITFDLGLIERFGCHVWGFDPTPRAVDHVAIHGRHQLYHFRAYGLWDEDTTLKFYAPRDRSHVSHSALNLQNTTDYFEARCQRLRSAMDEHGHTHLDLLKLDIEGAEYKVLSSLLADKIRASILCVEFDEVNMPLDSQYRHRIRASIDDLVSFGYRLVALDSPGNYTFVRD